MSYSIIGFGAVGQALARAFARKGIDVIVATRRPPEQLVDQAKAIGPNVKSVTRSEAIQAGTILLAMPFAEHGSIGAEAVNWDGRLVIDVSNAFGVPLPQFEGLSASAYAARNYTGARFAKAFNHLPAAKLAADPAVQGGRRVIFVSTDDERAREPANALISMLGFAPVSLGNLAESGPLVSAREDHWSPLAFQDLVKFDAA
jgi:8-hydroxy-5-deazaflavin:NADPH oxidoreductase